MLPRTSSSSKGYELKVAHEAVDLVCTRLESFLWEGHAKRHFRPYRVWVVDIEHTDAPHIRASRGLLQGHHLVVTPQVPTMGGASHMSGIGLSGRRVLKFEATGVPQLAPDANLGGTSTKARSIVSDNFHRVTVANPVLSLLNVPPPDPHKAHFFFFLDCWTLDSAPLGPQLAQSTWRFSWSANPSRYPAGVERALNGLPGGSFLVPTHKDDRVVTADRLDRDETIQGIAVVFNAHANDPAARPSSAHAAHAAEHVARAHREREDGEASGFDVGRSKTCVVM
ncbi:uncharacterized protein RHOBADRAFT_55868 [Rhodotorula graminis WP1]|uniref:Uncharacterized protein n=1 Tax=Rhodotorula graminis (strain WP1) TaxID=578459 RepID=A0A0P9EL19_RHOGW|nr:uncharacterized protein RHOBADRAFT_55868 [Rhodotorula graminis WP1]KPV72400.1 hypothetical protein RHOBADRAFT_55868 [Rhodotorula graminis WP1]